MQGIQKMINSNLFLSTFSLAEKRAQLCDYAILFVYNQLPLWRDDKNRRNESSEELLNSQLCKFLDLAARHSEEAFLFHNEEHQDMRRRIDISAYPDSELLPPDLYASPCDDTITVFEAKRLPAPTHEREKEYVLSTGDTVGGGIQRFKLGFHGAKHDAVAMVGYIQKYDSNTYFLLINQWLRELAGTIAGKVLWLATEQLKRLDNDTAKKTLHAVSTHSRENDHPVTIHHLWVELVGNDSKDIS